MDLKAGDFVEIVAIPSRIERASLSEQQVYRSCLGIKLVVARVDEDGLCVFELHQEWSHFPGITPFDLKFDAACLRKIEPFPDAEWATLANWAERDARLSGEVIEIAGRLSIRLDGGIVGDLALPDGASRTDYLGTTLPVRIIKLSRKKRDLILWPASA